jgi:hypothetical protein
VVRDFVHGCPVVELAQVGQGGVTDAHSVTCNYAAQLPLRVLLTQRDPTVADGPVVHSRRRSRQQASRTVPQRVAGMASARRTPLLACPKSNRAGEKRWVTGGLTLGTETGRGSR